MGAHRTILDNSEEEETRFRGICRALDIPGLAAAAVTTAAWIAARKTRVSPMFVPEGDSLSAFPRTGGDTVPFGAAVAAGLAANAALCAGAFFLQRRFPRALRRFNPFAAAWAVVTSLSLACAIANVLKSRVGRPRPDMYAHCGNSTNYATCRAPGERSGEFKSWPSGHATAAVSLSASAVSFVQSAARHRSTLYSAATSLLMLFGYYVGATRIRDHRHHADDVLAGIVLGFITNSLVWAKAEDAIFSDNEEIYGNYSLTDCSE